MIHKFKKLMTSKNSKNQLQILKIIKFLRTTQLWSQWQILQFNNKVQVDLQFLSNYLSVKIMKSLLRKTVILMKENNMWVTLLADFVIISLCQAVFMSQQIVYFSIPDSIHQTYFLVRPSFKFLVQMFWKFRKSTTL